MRRYTWAIYAERLLSLARIYSFWKFVSSDVLDRSDADEYLSMFYLLQIRPMLQKVSQSCHSVVGLALFAFAQLRLTVH